MKLAWLMYTPETWYQHEKVLIITGPQDVLKTVRRQGVLESVHFEGPAGKPEETTVGNVVPYHPRKDGDKRPG
ncbi:hypothetical protein MTO96_042006 [Rhipicephalus appendiculatus]